MHQQVYKEHCTVGWAPDEFYRVVADVEQYSVFLPWCLDSIVHTSRRVRVPAPNYAMSPMGGPAASTTGATQSSSSATPPELVDAIEMTATLAVGFSFFKEQYTSKVTLIPGRHITAALYEPEEGEESFFGLSASAATRSLSSAASSSSSGDSHSPAGMLSSLLRKAAHTAGVAAKKSILRNLLCEWEFAPVPGRANEVEVVFSVAFEFKNPLHSKMIMSNVVTLMTRSFEKRCELLYGPPSASRQALPIPNA